MTRSLDIARTVVAIPAFHALGHTVTELPTHAPVDAEQSLIRFNPVAAMLDVVRQMQSDRFQPVGIWTSDLIAYDRAVDQADLRTWVLRKAAHWSERARRALFWREARPLGVLERVIAQNVITDYGALQELHTIGSAAPTQFFNHMVLATGAATAQVSSAMGSTGVTSIPVIAGGTSFTNGMSITLGYGTANAETLTVTSGATSTSIPVTTGTAHTHSANDWVVQNPLTADNPSSVSNAYDSGALAGGAFAYSGAGAGSRQVQVIYSFPANASAPGGGYTDRWMASAGTIASNTTASHLTTTPLLVNGSTGAQVTFTETM